MSSKPREVTDPDGRRVVFDERAERHLARHRPQILTHMPAILDTVARPDTREGDPAPGRESFFRRDLDALRWLRVVVDFTETPGFVVTALAQDHKPGGKL